jgi:hypothetical protein
MYETDGFTYASDEGGDLLWFISPGVCTTAGGSAKPRQPSRRPSRTRSDPVDLDPLGLSSRRPRGGVEPPRLRLEPDRIPSLQEHAQSFVDARLQIINDPNAPAGDRLRAMEQLESRALGKPKESVTVDTPAVEAAETA